MMDRYDVSKLLEVMLVASINEAMKQGPNAGKPLILNNVNPGLCHSDLDRDLKVCIHFSELLPEMQWHLLCADSGHRAS
jgi:hypothetical protein